MKLKGFFWIFFRLTMALTVLSVFSFGEQALAQQQGIISFNTVTAVELMQIEDIDLPKSLAEAIVDYREKNGRFKDPLDLRKVPGMTDYFYEELNPVMNEEETDVIYNPDAEPALAPSKC